MRTSESLKRETLLGGRRLISDATRAPPLGRCCDRARNVVRDALCVGKQLELPDLGDSRIKPSWILSPQDRSHQHHTSIAYVDTWTRNECADVILARGAERAIEVWFCHPEKQFRAVWRAAAIALLNRLRRSRAQRIARRNRSRAGGPVTGAVAPLPMTGFGEILTPRGQARMTD